MNFKNKYFSFLIVFFLFTLSCSKTDNDIPQDFVLNNFIWKGLNAFYLWQEDINDLKDTRFNNQKGSWIYAPSQVIVTFPGNEEFLPIELEESEEKIVDLKLETKIFTRFVKLKLVNFGVIPDGKQGAGHKPWIFIDEIIIE